MMMMMMMNTVRDSFFVFMLQRKKVKMMRSPALKIKFNPYSIPLRYDIKRTKMNI